MELSKLDLNLLLVFHHLLILKRVSAVADFLNMSQPAVSSALGRLRSSLGDELFIRTQGGMTPHLTRFNWQSPWPWRWMYYSKP
jgi:DNA-binding transcriptional LysR family regulator